MPSTKRILDVGQCGVDGPRLSRFLSVEFDCVIDHAGSRREALELATKNPYDLVLVNRILARDGSPGISVIASLLAAQPRLRVMLVSDYADAQEEAIELGALPGFGKAELESAETEERLRSVLAPTG